MGKNPFCFRRPSIRRRRPKSTISPQSPPPDIVVAASSLSPPPPSTGSLIGGARASRKEKKKAGGARLWMRFDASGVSELVEYEKSTIIKRASIPARDFRILGPLFSHSSAILARERAVVVNLEFIKAIVTAEEILILDPLQQEVLPFVDQLRLQLPCRSAVTGDINERLPVPEAMEDLQGELPFEFQVLEIALEVVCSFLDKTVAELERDAYPALDELARNVSTENLEHVRSLKSNLTRLLARVQKVRDEIEHLLDDNEDMANLYLTRKWIQNQQPEVLPGAAAPNSITAIQPRLGSNRSGSMASIHNSYNNDVEDLEMLLEAYFIQLDRTRNKILSVREYIDDTEDYVNIQLDNQRNELIQLQLILTIASFAIAIETAVAGWCGVNIPFSWNNKHGVYGIFVGGTTAMCVLIFLIIVGYARWKKLLGS